MLKRFFFIFILPTILLNTIYGQQNNSVNAKYIEKEQTVAPGQIINMAFMVTNNYSESLDANCTISAPPGWKTISNSQSVHINPNEKKLVLFTVQAGTSSSVGDYYLRMFVVKPGLADTLSSTEVLLKVKEIEKISLLLVNYPKNINAGETFEATYLLQNLGNTTKKIFIETQNCDIEGSSEIELDPGNSTQFNISSQTSEELTDAKKAYFTIRAVVSGEVKKSIYSSYTVFPTKEGKKDLYFRFPVSLSTTYITSNLQDKQQSGYQFQISGSGTLDPEGKHQLEFLARGPNISNLSYLGLYNQYFLSYKNKNIEFFVGDKAYNFTPLTESSRFGFGTDSKITLNNGFNFGFIYVEPRFFNDFRNEMAGFTGFEFNKENNIKLYYVQKNSMLNTNPARLASISTHLSPFKRTNVDLELSRGSFNNTSDNAMRASINTQTWIFHLAGIYFYTGKNYPGYYSNSTFYSGNLSARISKKLSLGLFAKEDFRNAELDTFFISAPYSKSLQASINYNIAPRANLKFYWRKFERKDRLSLDKFHYNTKSLNTQFSHRFKKVDYNLLGEYGETTNLLLSENNQQTTYRGTVNLGYRFNSKNSIRLSGSWSNINSFVSGMNRNITAGLFVVSQITKNLKADLHVQNAYDIDDYYRNRNLMQFNLEYSFLKHHVISARSFYTIFKQHVDEPEFTATISYAYKFGVPLNQIIKAGDVRGQITYDNDESAEGIILTLQNKTAITDNNGNFFISTIQPGRHLLYVDRSRFDINEITSIPTPIEIDVIEDKETVVNFKITTGAKLTGKITIEESGDNLLRNSNVNARNIIVELKDDFNQFRITTDDLGNFSFPLVRPGNYTFKIYENSIPERSELEKSEYQINLSPGEEENLIIELKLKKQNIIFQQQNLILTPSDSDKQTENHIDINKNDDVNTSEDSTFYSIQVGAFSQRQDNNSTFFINEHFDFEKQIGNMYKYFIGRYKTLEEAKTELERLQPIFKNPFVVVFKNNELQK